MLSKKLSIAFDLKAKLPFNAIGLCGFLFLILIPFGSPVFAQIDIQKFPVKDSSSGQKVGDVQYNIVNGTVDDMSVDVGANSLYIPITTNSNGTLTVTLPRTLIDATSNGEDDQFYVLLDGQDSSFQESKTSTDRTLTVPFSDGTGEIDVVGTYVVPEFPIGAAIVFVLAVISIVAVSRKAKIRIS